jgi:hypothetical protein
MSKYLFEVTQDHHKNEIAIGLDMGYSKMYGNLRLSLTLLKYTIHFTIDWEPKNV